MLYSIIPPALIVISLIGIIVFLVKKAPKVALLKENETNDEQVATKSFFGRFKKSSDGSEKKDFKHNILLLLEKITRKLKLLFLKLENTFTTWSEIIRQKRRIRENEGKFSDIVSKREGRNINGENKIDNFFQRKKQGQVIVDKKEDKFAEKEKEVEKVVEKKDIFEKILIERIAANPKDIEAYERLGEYYFDIENWEYAKECFKQVIKLNPNNRNVKSKMRKLTRLILK